MKLSKLIQKILKDLDMRQYQLAEKLKVSQSTISFWMSGRLHLSYKNYQNLVKFCEKNGINCKPEERFFK